MHTKKPEIIVFAGPNGSGKSSVTKQARIVGKYINADEIKAATGCSDLDAASQAEKLRETALSNRDDFTFETVLSTRRNLDLLQRAKDAGYFIRCIYVVTKDPNINVYRVMSRLNSGGHGVPADKVIKRYERCFELLPEVSELADTFYLYDNSDQLTRVAVKKRGILEIHPNEFWTDDEVQNALLSHPEAI